MKTHLEEMSLLTYGGGGKCPSPPRKLGGFFNVILLLDADEIAFAEKWTKYEGLVFNYGPLEQKKPVKYLPSQYMSEESDNAGV